MSSERPTHSWALGPMPDEDMDEVREIGRDELDAPLMEAAAPPLKVHRKGLEPSRAVLNTAEVSVPPLSKKTPLTPVKEVSHPKLKRIDREAEKQAEAEPKVSTPVIEEFPPILVPKLEKIELPPVLTPVIPALEKVKEPKFLPPPPPKIYNNLENMYLLLAYFVETETTTILMTMSETTVKRGDSDFHNLCMTHCQKLIDDLYSKKISTFYDRASYRGLEKSDGYSHPKQKAADVIYKVSYVDNGKVSETFLHNRQDEEGLTMEECRKKYIEPPSEIIKFTLIRLKMDHRFDGSLFSGLDLRDLSI